MGDVAWFEDGLDQGTKKRLQPSQEQVEVIPGGGEDGICAVAFVALEVVAVHAVLGLDVADHRLDRGAALHLPADGLGDPARLAGDPDPEFVRIGVPAIALVHVDAAHLDAGQFLHIGDGRAKSVAVIGIAVQRLRASPAQMDSFVRGKTL